jgi:DNA invertase Pin-like site-specific DNA recombinase
MRVSINRDKIKSSGPIIGALRVSTTEQAESGAGLAAQRVSIEAYAAHHGLLIDHWATDAGVSASLRPIDRPGLSEALTALATAHAGMLIVAKSDRIARRASDLLQLVDLAEHEHWQLVATDGSIDTATPHGKMMTTVMAAAAQLERDLIAQRTREGLAAKRDSGVRLGPPVRLNEVIRQRVAEERRAGLTMAAIADRLTEESVPTATGKARWFPSTVKSVLMSLERDAYAAQCQLC